MSLKPQQQQQTQQLVAHRNATAVVQRPGRSMAKTSAVALRTKAFAQARPSVVVPHTRALAAAFAGVVHRNAAAEVPSLALVAAVVVVVHMNAVAEVPLEVGPSAASAQSSSNSEA